MEVYLVRHGEAVDATVDPERPLSERGRSDVARIAAALRARGVRPAEIRHSGKLRARQTAEIIAAALGRPETAREAPGLGPNDDPAPVAAELEALADNVMLVGHLPFLERLAGLLAYGNPDRSPVTLVAGAVACLARRAPGSWEVAWTESP